MQADGKLHFSTLKNIGSSPKHYRYYADNEREDSDSFLIGRATHALVLQNIEPKIFHAKRVGNAYKEAVELNGGEDLLNGTQGELVKRMADAVNRSRLAQEILSRCPYRETELTWERGGFQCAGRDDAHGHDTLVELKTDKSVHPYMFKRTANWRRYPEQMAWYDVGLGTEYVHGETKWRDCYIIAVENNGPVFPVSVFRVTPIRLVQAHERVEQWLEKLRQCERQRYWPGWDESVEDIDWEIEVNEGDDDE